MGALEDDQRRADLELAAKLELLAAAFRSPPSQVIESPLQDVSPEFVRELMQSVELRLEERITNCSSGPSSNTATPRRSASQIGKRALDFQDSSRASLEQDIDWDLIKMRLQEDKYNEGSWVDTSPCPSAWPEPLKPAQEIPTEDELFDWDLFRAKLIAMDTEKSEPQVRPCPSAWPEPLRPAQEEPPRSAPESIPRRVQDEAQRSFGDIDWDMFKQRIREVDESFHEAPDAESTNARDVILTPPRPVREIEPPKHFGDIDWELFKKRLRETDEEYDPNKPYNRPPQILAPVVRFDERLPSQSRFGALSQLPSETRFGTPSQTRFGVPSRASSQYRVGRTSQAPSQSRLGVPSQYSLDRASQPPSQCRLQPPPPCKRQTSPPPPPPCRRQSSPQPSPPPCRRQTSPPPPPPCRQQPSPQPSPPPCRRQPSPPPPPCRQQFSPQPPPSRPPCIPCGPPPAERKQVFQSRIPRYQRPQRGPPQQVRRRQSPPPSRIPVACPERLAVIRRIPRTFPGPSRIPRPIGMSSEDPVSDLSDESPFLPETDNMCFEQYYPLPLHLEVAAGHK